MSRLLLALFLAISFCRSAIAAEASPFANDPPGFRVIDPAPNVFFGQLKVDDRKNIYYVDSSGNVTKLAPPATPHGRWTSTVLQHVDTSGVYAVSYQLLLGPGGILYGALQSGAGGCGEVYSLTPPTSGVGSWTYATLYAFPCNAFRLLSTGLVMDSSGALYGGGYGTGNVGALLYQLTPPPVGKTQWSESTIYTSTAPEIFDQLGMDARGDLYTVETPGIGQASFVLELKPPVTKKSPWFPANIFQFPISTLAPYFTVAPNGVLYGSTRIDGCGDVIALIPAGDGSDRERTLFQFLCSGRSHGSKPDYLALGADGSLYGTTEQGGDRRAGVVFRLTPQRGRPWRESVLHEFTRTPNGAYPDDVAVGPGGRLFGETLFDGRSEFGGTIWELAL